MSSFGGAVLEPDGSFYLKLPSAKSVCLRIPGDVQCVECKSSLFFILVDGWIAYLALVCCGGCHRKGGPEGQEYSSRCLGA